MRDRRVKEYIAPTRIVMQSAGVKNAEVLLKNRYTQVVNMPEWRNGTDTSQIMRATKGDYVVFDFGRELHGGVRILTINGSAGAGNECEISARIRFGESVGECCAQLEDGTNALNQHSTRDMCVHLSLLSDMEFGQTGFRFVRIDFLADVEFSLLNVYAAYVFNDIPYVGNFRCSDGLVNQIYDTARYTVHLNMQNMLWDGIKRDRLVWVGDMHPEVVAITDIFGKNEFVEEAIDLMRETYALPRWMVFPTYSAWWIKIVCDYFIKTGDVEFTQRQLPYMSALLKQLDAYVNDDGSMNEKVGSKNFFDWPSFADEVATEMGTRYLFVYTLNSCKDLMKRFDMKSEFSLCEKICRKLLIKNSYGGEFKQVHAFSVLSRVKNACEAESVLTKGGAKGLSTYMSYYILRAISEGGNTQKALEIMKEYYGGMLSRGATSFWEDFNVEWLKGSGRIDEPTPEGIKDLHGDYGAFCYKGFRHSLCHGWSCGPVQFLTEFVLGITVEEAGCKVIRVRPNLCGLSFAEGCVPTPFGTVSVRAEMVNGELKTQITASSDVQIIA